MGLQGASRTGQPLGKHVGAVPVRSPRGLARQAQGEEPDPVGQLWSCALRGRAAVPVGRTSVGPQGPAHPHRSPPLPPQGSGRYSIYIANYAYGNVGPDALIEMDPEASDLSRGILALRDVAAEAGVSKYTGMQGGGEAAHWRGWGARGRALQSRAQITRDRRRGRVPGEGG